MSDTVSAGMKRSSRTAATEQPRIAVGHDDKDGVSTSRTTVCQPATEEEGAGHAGAEKSARLNVWEKT